MEETGAGRARLHRQFTFADAIENNSFGIKRQKSCCFLNRKKVEKKVDEGKNGVDVCDYRISGKVGPRCLAGRCSRPLPLPPVVGLVMPESRKRKERGKLAQSSHETTPANHRFGYKTLYSPAQKFTDVVLSLISLVTCCRGGKNGFLV